MAKVYTGKVIIPGDKLDEFLQAMKEAEAEREPFYQSLISFNQEFEQYLSTKYSARTARKHASIIELFIEFICRQTDVERIEEITKGMVNTHFKKWWKRKVLSSTTPDELATALRKFFIFLSTEKNIVNENVLKALQ